MTKLVLFALILAAPLGHALVVLEARGDRLCAADRCFERLPLGPNGLDLVDQLSRFETHFDADFAPKGGAKSTFKDLLGVAGALGLGEESRARLLATFSRLSLTDLAANLIVPAGAAAAPDVEIPFVARLAWADHGSNHGVTDVAGRLVFARGRELDVTRPARDLNTALSALVRIDDTSRVTPTTDQLTELVAPAVLGNVVFVYLSPPEHLAGTALAPLGQLFTGAGPAR